MLADSKLEIDLRSSFMDLRATHTFRFPENQVGKTEDKKIAECIHG
jgi:hypothetical protein